MKKIAIALLILITLTACAATSSESSGTQDRFSANSGSGDGKVITDENTGCKYLFFKVANAGGLSPLYKSNGEIDCDKSTP